MANLNQNQKTNKTVVPDNAKEMSNSAMWVEGDSLVIVVRDLKKRLRLSSTGVSYIVGGGDGNLSLPEPFSTTKLIMTVITKDGIAK